MIIEKKAADLVLRLLEISPGVYFSPDDVTTGAAWGDRDWWKLSIVAVGLKQEFLEKVVLPYIRGAFDDGECNIVLQQFGVVFQLTNPLSELLDSRWWARFNNAMEDLEVEEWQYDE